MDANLHMCHQRDGEGDQTNAVLVWINQTPASREEGD